MPWAAYPHLPRRGRPDGRKWSQMVAGRLAAYDKMWRGEAFTVSAYRVSDGRIFYTDPVDPRGRAGRGVLDRIHIIPKVTQ